MGLRSRRRVLARCARCRLHFPMCVCAELPRLATRARVVLVPHPAEWDRPSNTGRIAMLSLVRAELAVWRHDLDLSLLLREGHDHLLLHPSGEPVACGDRPVSLIVPDGTWRESSRIARRLMRIPGVRCARIDPSPRAGIRRAPDAHRIGTGEAIAEALDALGEDAGDPLRAAVRLMVERTLWQRGMAPAAQIPLEVRRAMGSPPRPR
jgi:DTW domain-containing protein YfiP